MKTLILAAILMGSAAAADTIPGGSALPCTDATAFTPIYAADGSVAYWNNPTCSSIDGWDMTDEQRENLYPTPAEPVEVASE